MNTPQKHATLIHAWADGAEIEARQGSSTTWVTVDSPTWSIHGTYSIKPEPKPDVVETFFAHSEFGRPRLAEHWEKVNLALTYDGETGKLKAAEVI